MRLHRLAAQAFGPFPGRVEVDLDALASAGIFLIHGPTGAGKTSLLDAICFALYAAVPGARPAGRSLRSDHASHGAAPRVELEFTAVGRRLCIVRSPEFRRPKRRGTGETTVPASVLLTERVGGQWEALSHRADEVGELVKDVLGIGLEQFVKVVLLPQGDFAAFLRASPESRRELLERLFDVSRFTDVEDWLIQQRRAGAVRLAETQAALAMQLTRVDDVLARLPPELSAGVAAWADVSHRELEGAVATVLGRVRGVAAAALAERDAAEARERDRLRERDWAARQLVCRQKAQQAGAVLADLAAREDELNALGERVALARRAACVAGDLRALADAAARTSAARDRANAATERVGELGPGLDVMDAAAAEKLAGVLSTFDACLAEVAALDQALGQARRRVGAQQQVTAVAAQNLAAVEADVERLLAVSAELAERRRTAAAAAAVVPQALRDVDHVLGLLRLRTTLDARLAQLSDARGRAGAADDAARVAHARWLDMRQAQLDALAARLATELVDGQPCPVCGSARHPSPADSAAAVPDDAVAAAEAEWTARRALLEAAQGDVAASEGAVLTLGEHAGVLDREAAALAADLAAAQDRLGIAQAHADQLAALEAHHDEVVDELMSVRERQDQAQRAMQEASGRLDAMRAEAERTEQDLSERRRRHTDGCPCATGSPSADHGAAPTRHTEVTVAVAELLEASKAGAEATRHESATTRAVSYRLADNGFDSVAEARAAFVAQDTLASHERLLRQAERERVQAQTVLADPEVAQALRAEETDLAALEEELAHARRTRQLTERTSTLAEQSDRDLTQLRVLVAEHAHRVAELSDRHTAIARLADTAGGLGPDNTLRMRLSAYVLAARLERVVELANERLAAMGDGRYRLRHSDAPVAGGRRSGLGLMVEDLWTGQARDTATLSGGESFVASLALALALADGVREEAGGFDLQTLFIDEGFGSLDEDSLEQVLDVLDGLREGGRAVGVVSHVADLRARIPNQLHVTKTAAGSRVSLVGGDAA